MTVYFQLTKKRKKKTQNNLSFLWRIGTLQKKNVRFGNGPLAMSEFTLCSRNCLKHLSENLTVVAGSRGPTWAAWLQQSFPGWKKTQSPRAAWMCTFGLTTPSLGIHLHGPPPPPAFSPKQLFHRHAVVHNGSFFSSQIKPIAGLKTFLSSLLPCCPDCDTAVLAKQLVSGKKKQGKVDRYQRRGVLCGLLESLSSGFHLKTQRCFLTCFVFILTMNGAASLVSK